MESAQVAVIDADVLSWFRNSVVSEPTGESDWMRVITNMAAPVAEVLSVQLIQSISAREWTDVELKLRKQIAFDCAHVLMVVNTKTDRFVFVA